jgi:hypothetical protein
MNIYAEIKGLKYKPFLCRKLNIFNFDEIDKALSSEATFILEIEEESQVAVSWWVSPKRTRSYPYARVYDSLDFWGKKVTLIPVIKDEGREGDRDFLQWDTISLMSLLGVYVIISYYADASKSSTYEHKITNQRFDLEHVKGNIRELLSYQSDALHWNFSQIDRVGEISSKAIEAYAKISQKLGVEMHSQESAEERIEQLLKGKEEFMRISRELAQKAQKRESETVQPKEHLTGIKGTLTIKNYLGGYYYFTCDEIEIHGEEIYLIEGKHTKASSLPSLEDIKDGLLKMILFTNLENLKLDGRSYKPVPILKLTSGIKSDIKTLLKNSQKDMLETLRKEAKLNEFKVIINDEVLNLG